MVNRCVTCPPSAPRIIPYLGVDVRDRTPKL